MVHSNATGGAAYVGKDQVGTANPTWLSHWRIAYRDIGSGTARALRLCSIGDLWSRTKLHRPCGAARPMLVWVVVRIRVLLGSRAH